MSDLYRWSYPAYEPYLWSVFHDPDEHIGGSIEISLGNTVIPMGPSEGSTGFSKYFVPTKHKPGEYSMISDRHMQEYLTPV